MKTTTSTYQEAADFLAGLIPDMPQTAIILGSGLGALADRLTDTPFNRMQTVTTVCDMGRPDIFAGRQQVINPLRDQGAQRYLKRQRIYINVIISAERRMKIDTIVANADTVVEFGDSGLSRSELAIFLPDMLFRNRKQGFDASRLAYVRIFSHPVVGAEHVATQT